MLALGAALGLVLGALAPADGADTAVVLGGRIGVSQKRADRALASLGEQLRGAMPLLAEDELTRRFKSIGVSDGTFCAGKKTCLLELGRQLRLAVLIAVSASEVGGELSITAVAYDPAAGRSLAEASVVLPANTRDLDAELRSLAATLAAALELARPHPSLAPAPSPGPPAAPSPAPAPLTAVSSTGQRRSRVPSILFLVAAAAAAGSAVGLGVSGGISGSSLRGNLELADGTRGSDLTERAAAQRRDTANAELSAALACAVGAALFAVLTVVLWPPPEVVK
jgi:hypothetical protein